MYVLSVKEIWGWKKKKEEKETLSILQQCFECERKASKWERFGPSDLNDNPRPFILIGRHQDRLKKGYARHQTCESMAFSRHFTPSELTCERKWHCWRFLRGFLLIWSSEEYLYSFFLCFSPLHPTVFGDRGFSYSLNCMHVPWHLDLIYCEVLNNHYVAGSN